MTADEHLSRAGLTRLTRLAQREPQTIDWIVRVLTKNFPAIVAPAIDVAVETGDPMPEALSLALERAGSAEACEEVARHVPLTEGPLQAVAISATERLLADAGWPADRLRRLAVEIGLGRRLIVAGRPSEARAVLERAIDGLRRDETDDAFELLIGGYDALSMALTGLGEHAASVTAARTAYDLQGEGSPSGALQLGIALRAAEDPEAATALARAVTGFAEQVVSSQELFSELATDRSFAVAMQFDDEGFSGFSEVADAEAMQESLNHSLVSAAVELAGLLAEADQAAVRALAGARPALRLAQPDPRSAYLILAALARRSVDVATDLRRVAESARDLGDLELASAALQTQIEAVRAGSDDPAALIDALQGRVRLLAGSDGGDVDLHALRDRGQVTSINLTDMDPEDRDALLDEVERHHDAVEQMLEEFDEAVALAEVHSPERLPELLHMYAGLQSSMGLMAEALETSVRAAALAGDAFLARPDDDVDSIVGTLFELAMSAKGDRRLVPDVAALEATTVEALRRATVRPRGTLSRLAAATAVLIESAIEEDTDLAGRLYDALLAVANDHPDEAALQVARGMQGSQLLSVARESGDFARALDLYRDVAAAARALPGDRVLLVEHAICAADTMQLAANAGDETMLAFLAADAREALGSAEYLEVRAREVGDDPAPFVAAVHELADDWWAHAEDRRRIEGLLRVGPRRGGERLPSIGRLGPQDLGVAAVPDAALELLGGDEPAYVPRDIDAALDAVIRAAQASPTPALVVLAGEPGSGRTRTLFEAARRNPVLRDAPLAWPRDPAALTTLLDEPVLSERLVLWLDDAEPFLAAGSAHLLDRLGTGVVVLATAGLGVATGALELRRELSSAECARLEETELPGAVARDLARDGFGATLGAAPALLQRMADGDQDGVAVLQAAIDWCLCGFVEPIPDALLCDLWRHYAADERRFDAALAWACAPVHDCVAALRTSAAHHEAAGWLVAAAAREQRVVPAAAWEEMLEAVDPQAALTLADAAVKRDRNADAARAYRAATGSASPDVAGRAGYFLGMLLAEQGELQNALAAFERVIAAGHSKWAPRCAIQAGLHLTGVGDRKHARGMFEAALAYDDAEMRATAGFNLANLLLAEDDVDGACELYERVIASGDAEQVPKSLVNLGIVRRRQGDIPTARALFERARTYAHDYAAPRAAVELGDVLSDAGDTAAARDAYQQALDSGHPDLVPRAAMALGGLHYNDGDLARAEAAYSRAVDSGDADTAPRAALLLGFILSDQGRTTAAREAFELAARASDDDISLWAQRRLGVLLAKQGEFERARELLERVAHSEHPEHSRPAAEDLATLRARVGDRRH